MANRAPWRRQLPAFVCFLIGIEPVRALVVGSGNVTPDVRSTAGLIAQAVVFLGLALWLLLRAGKAVASDRVA